MATHSSHKVFGSVAVDEELTDLLEPSDIDEAIVHLRMGGGNCWDCKQSIHRIDSASLVAHATSAGIRLGFFHLACAPPQVIDDRRNRRAALRMAVRLDEIATEVQAFLVVRNNPAPHAVLVVSAENAMRFREQNGDGSSPWLDILFEEGFALAAPDVMDLVPDLLPGWLVEAAVDGTVVCGREGHDLFSGQLEIPSKWRAAVRDEGQCLLIVCAFGVSTNELGNNFDDALNFFAAQGLVVCAGVAARCM